MSLLTELMAALATLEGLHPPVELRGTIFANSLGPGQLLASQNPLQSQTEVAASNPNLVGKGLGSEKQSKKLIRL